MADNTNQTPEVEVKVNDFFAGTEVFLEDYFPVDMLNAEDPEKFPYHAEDLIGLPDNTSKRVEEGSNGEETEPTSTVAAPVFKLENTTLTITCETEGAVIYYTNNGNDPTENGTQYSEAITYDAEKTYKAAAKKDNEWSSVVTYTAA